MSKIVLITGATGLLGRQVAKAFEDCTVIATGYSRAQPPVLKLDLGSAEEIANVVDAKRPDIVVHCAANRFPDKCDADPEGTRALNVHATQALASITAARSILLIYISSDYVFPGTEGEAPYEVAHPPHPPNLYGQTKHDGEKVVLEAYKTAGREGLGVVLRVPVLYGQAESPKESAVNVLVETVWKAQKERVAMDHWSLRYPTNTEDVARVIRDIAAKYRASPDPARLPTILQFSSQDRFTKYEICQLLAEILGLPLGKMEANTDGNAPDAVTKRPYDCHLSTKVLKELGINVATQDFKGWWRRECRAFRH